MARLLLALLWLAPASAGALPLVPDPLVFGLGVSGQVAFVSLEPGPPGAGSDLAGAVGATDSVLVFELTLDAGSQAMAPVGVFAVAPGGAFRSVTGGGVVPGSGPATGATLGTDSVEFCFGAAPCAALGAGATTDRLYVGWSDLQPGDQVGFILATQPPPGMPILRRDVVFALVPEPGRGLVWLAALLALAAGLRRA